MSETLNKLGLQQLHQDQQKLAEQNKYVIEVLEKLLSKDYKTVLPQVFKVKADSLPAVEIDGEVKAVVDGGTVSVLNFAELEQYFLGLQLSLVETIASENPVRITNPDLPVTINQEQIDNILSLLANIADKDVNVVVEQNGQSRIEFPTAPQKAIAVRLVTADGKAFYDALANGGNSAGIPDRLISGDRLKVVLEGAIEVGDVTIGSEVEIKNDDGNPVPTTVQNLPSDFPLPTSQVTTLTPQTDALTDDELRATPVTVTVDNFPAPDESGLTDAQLRATPVPVDTGVSEYPLPASQVTDLKTITLDATSLAALENITATLSGAVALDANTLAALENIIVTGTVALDAPTLAALENINATVSGTVALDPATLSALENITATVSGSVSISNLPTDYPLPASQVTTLTPQTNALTDAQLRASDVPVKASEKYTLLPYAQVLTADDTITPATGKKIQLVWVQIVPSSDNGNANLVTIKMTIGGVVTNIYKVYALGRTAVFTGDTNAVLTIDLATAEPVSVNIQYREVT